MNNKRHVKKERWIETNKQQEERYERDREEGVKDFKVGKAMRNRVRR